MNTYRSMSTVDMEAYRQFNTTKIGNDHSISLHEELYKFATMDDSSKKDIIETVPYINELDAFPNIKGYSYYRIKVELITRLQQFQNNYASNIIDPGDELAQTMELNAILDTMKVNGARFYLPTLLGNEPHPKQCVSYKKKSQYISELCEYIKIRTNNADFCQILLMYLTDVLEKHVTPQDTSTVIKLIVDIMGPATHWSYLTSINLIVWAASEYITFSFGVHKVY